MQQFELILKNEKTRSYRLIRFFILLANAAGMIWLITNAAENRDKLWPSLALVAIGLFMIFTFVDVINKKYSYETMPRMAYLWCAIAWSRSPMWWFSVVLLLFFILDILAHRKLIIKVGSFGVSYPSLTGKKISWAELNNLLLKDGMLTIDFRNNRLFQHLIANAETDINERDFNEFCKQQLKVAAVAK